jgi:AcrR family transcriptional regulator
VTARYHSPLREEQSAATHARILEACVALLQAGGSLTYGAVAAKARVQDRTVYRHFPTKEDLETAVWNWILEHVTHVDFSSATADDLIDSMRRSFAGFDAGAPLIQAMLHSQEGLDVRLRQQPARQSMFEACVDQASPGLDPQTRRRAAAALQVLYSATAWDQLRSFWGMTGSEAADVIEMAIRSLFVGLRYGGRTKDQLHAKRGKTA